MANDLRRYARHTNIRLAVGFILILFIVGDGLIFVFYGRNAGLMGLVCLSSAMLPVILIVAALWVIDRIVRSNR